MKYIIMPESEYEDLKQDIESARKNYNRLSDSKDAVDAHLRFTEDRLKRYQILLTAVYDKKLPLFGRGRKVRDLP